MPKYVISLLVENKKGIVSHILNIFDKCDINIESLTFNECVDKKQGRININVFLDDDTAKNILSKLLEIDSVLKADYQTEDNMNIYELMLLKVSARPEERGIIYKTAFAYGARIIDVGQKSMTLQAVGTPDEINTIINHVKAQGILEICRSGITSLKKGDESL